MVDQIESCSPNTLVQCRICHDEDEDLNMDTPCSCSGTLQYAHRICVQRWCNEKGDTTCEICQQVCTLFLLSYSTYKLFKFVRKKCLIMFPSILLIVLLNAAI